MARPLPEAIARPDLGTIELSEIEWGMLDGRFEYAVLNFGTASGQTPQEGDWAEWTSGGDRYRYRVTCLGLAGYTPGSSGMLPIYNWEASQTPLPGFPEGIPLEFRLEPLNKNAQILERSGYRRAGPFEVNELTNLVIDCAEEARVFTDREEVLLHNIGGRLTPVIKSKDLHPEI